jgi:hypothetical protein
MRYRVWVILLGQALLMGAFLAGVRIGLMPLGVRGEWEWMRLPDWAALSWVWLALAGLSVLAYSGFVALGLRALARSGSRWREPAWLTGLLLIGIGVQVMIPTGAPPGYDLTKWAAVNYLPSSSGYFKIARRVALADPWRFMKEYPDWIRSQDSLHIGTHPPGLIVLQCLLLETMHANTGLASFLLAGMPASVDAGFQVFGVDERKPLTPPERAALYATALLTLLACAGTVVPLYLLARAVLPATAAWSAAALWPLAPAANLFQPVADTAYPFLSTVALALCAWAAREPTKASMTTRSLLAFGSGIVVALGTYFTLAFLPVALIVASLLGASWRMSWPQRGVLGAAAIIGFLTPCLAAWATTAANPFVIATWNLYHHARFYTEYPRSYHIWIWVNLIELVIALGLPSAVWCAVGLLRPRTVPASVWCTLFVLGILNLTGRNLGEVARLWMFLMPPLLVAAGQGCDRLGSGPYTLAISAGLLGLQTLALQAMIQVVYPV